MRLTLALLACLIAAPASGQPTSPIRIGEVRVQLFQERTATFSNDLLGPDPPVLGNVIIGDDPSDSFLVTIGLDGPPNSYQDAELRVTVRSRGGRPVPETRRLRGFLFRESGRTHRAIMVHHRNCAPVEIDLRIGGESRRVDLGFRCYE